MKDKLRFPVTFTSSELYFMKIKGIPADMMAV